MVEAGVLIRKETNAQPVQPGDGGGDSDYNDPVKRVSEKYQEKSDNRINHHIFCQNSPGLIPTASSGVGEDLMKLLSSDRMKNQHGEYVELQNDEKRQK